MSSAQGRNIHTRGIGSYHLCRDTGASCAEWVGGETLPGGIWETVALVPLRYGAMGSPSNGESHLMGNYRRQGVPSTTQGPYEDLVSGRSKLHWRLRKGLPAEATFNPRPKQ